MASTGNADLSEISRKDFPQDFMFGVATSAYQVEGAAKEGGRGPSIWDVFAHTQGKIKGGATADISDDQYHRYEEDVALLSKLGFDAYRFSISWSRIYPDGLGCEVNLEGIAYYNKLINTLLEKGIQPFVTLYHWDLPANLQDLFGGWLSDKIIKYFSIYAETCFASFGDRVKYWITINEPLQTAINGYGVGIMAPGRNENSLVEPYLAAHYQLLAHAAAVSVYRKKFKSKQDGKIGIAVDCEWAEAFSDKLDDRGAAQRRIDFQLGWFLDPIYHGDYPACMREKVGDRLPKFSDAEKVLLRESLDFVGLNHYTTRLISHSPRFPGEANIYMEQEVERIVQTSAGELIGLKAASEWLYIVPWGIRKVLNYISERYNSPAIYVTENGVDEEDGELPLDDALNDTVRIHYYRKYLAAVADSVGDGTLVKGYFAWSFLDNFEWAEGYTKRFGLVYVDYNNGLSRHLKHSALWFSHFLQGEGK